MPNVGEALGIGWDVDPVKTLAFLYVVDYNGKPIDLSACGFLSVCLVRACRHR